MIDSICGGVPIGEYKARPKDKKPEKEEDPVKVEDMEMKDASR